MGILDGCCRRLYWCEKLCRYFVAANVDFVDLSGLEVNCGILGCWAGHILFLSFEIGTERRSMGTCALDLPRADGQFSRPRLRSTRVAQHAERQ